MNEKIHRLDGRRCRRAEERFRARRRSLGQRVLMKLGCQSAPTNETHLQYLARYGVRNICGYPEIGEGRLYATVDELKRMRDLAEKKRHLH